MSPVSVIPSFVLSSSHNFGFLGSSPTPHKSLFFSLSPSPKEFLATAKALPASFEALLAPSELPTAPSEALPFLSETHPIPSEALPIPS